MYEQVMQLFHQVDIVIKTAAVADYRPVKIMDQKIKKKTGPFSVDMERTVDILGSLGQNKNRQF